MTTNVPTSIDAIPGEASQTRRPQGLSGSCPECRGRGYVTLLVSHARCCACNGSGRTGGELDQHVATIGLSIRAIQGLASIGVRTVREAAKLSDRQLIAAPGMDAGCLEKLEAAMRRLGIRHSTAA